MTQDTFNSLEKLFNPQKLKDTLIRGSIYLSAYELLKTSIIGHLTDFFANKWTLNETTGEIETVQSENYKKKVRSLYPKDEFHSCCLWFFENMAISKEDLDAIPKIRKHRNSIAHEFPKFLSSANYEVDKNLLNKTIEIIRKVDTWWIKEVEVPTNPDFDHMNYDEINWDEVLSGNMIMMSFLASIYNGDDTLLKLYHKKFIEIWKSLQG